MTNSTNVGMKFAKPKDKRHQRSSFGIGAMVQDMRVQRIGTIFAEVYLPSESWAVIHGATEATVRPQRSLATCASSEARFRRRSAIFGLSNLDSCRCICIINSRRPWGQP